MRIAVNAIFLQKDKLEGFGHYAKEILSRLVIQHPEHEFIFVFDRPYAEEFIFSSNIIPIIVSPQARHILAFKYWYDIKASLALRSMKPDIWIQPYGFCSLSTPIPQILIIHDLAFLHYPEFIAASHRWFYRLYTRRFLQKATSVVTVSDYTKADIIKKYPSTDPEKITCIPGAARAIFQPLNWQDKAQVKDSFADGREYFLFTGGIHPRKNLMNLLKAFSLFKKWQHSNMKLLVVGRLAWQYEDLLEKLKSYKYRDDVVMLGYLPEDQLASITAAAYALVYPSYFEGFGLPIIEAMQSGVPVITSNTSAMPETGGSNALYASPNDPDAIATQMINLYRDESLRANLMEEGIKQADRFNWSRSADALWKNICAITGKG